MNEIEKALSNSKKIVFDSYLVMFIYNNHYSDIQNEKISNGWLSSAISLFSLIGFLSKVLTILCNGDKNITTQKDLIEFNRIKALINSHGISGVSKYLKKPRLGDINETNAFVHLVNIVPFDFGLSTLSNKEKGEIWNLFRNNLIHTLSLKGSGIYGQMLRVDAFINSSLEDSIISTRNRLKEHPVFDLTNNETKSILSKIEMKDNFKVFFTKDGCYVNRLAVMCEDIILWIEKTLELKKYESKNIIVLNNWLIDNSTLKN